MFYSILVILIISLCDIFFLNEKLFFWFIQFNIVSLLKVKKEKRKGIMKGYKKQDYHIRNKRKYLSFIILKKFFHLTFTPTIIFFSSFWLLLGISLSILLIYRKRKFNTFHNNDTYKHFESNFFNFFEIKSFCYNFNYAIIYSVVKIEIATPNVWLFKFVSLPGTFIKMSIIANTILVYN